MGTTGAGPVDVVVVAAGSSTRMGGIDKMTTPLAGRPLLAWTLQALRATPGLRDLVVVAGAGRVDELSRQPWLSDADARVVAGGRRRQESVAAGVAATRGGTVLVHDGARPLVTAALARRVADAVERHGAAIPVLAVADTLKRVDRGRVTATIPREGIAAAQTPQGARRELLEAAWARFPASGEREFTDEAALLEAAGIAVAVVDGEPRNLKVTEPADLARAETLLAPPGTTRIGTGSDSHPFGPADGLRLGGIEIIEAPRLHGHSDGDAALHAIADALLGSASLGDLGRWFPAGDPRTAGIDSAELLADVMRRVQGAGRHPVALDLTIVAARPRFGATRLEAMRERIALLLGLAPAAVSVKASTGNLDGADGAGRSISAHAVVTTVTA